jgi:very-short-patch-repair endonuclease
VARWQLLRLGLSAQTVTVLMRSGLLQPVFRGVYGVARVRLDPRGRWMAAVLASGEEALLGGRSAVALWELRPAPAGPVDVIDPERRRRGRTGIRVHGVRHLHPDDRAMCDGIPVTAVPRTLLDYAAVARTQQLRHAMEAAERRDLLDGRELDALLDRCRGHRGRAPLIEVLEQMRGPAPWTQSELERAFLSLVREAGLPAPQANVPVAGELVDFYWPEAALVVEIDGFEFHRTRARFEADRRRDARLQLAGIRVLRVTHRRIVEDPRGLIRDLRALLALGRGAAA